MSQPVGTQSNAPKNQLPLFNPANFITDQTATQESISATEKYITDNNVIQSAQIVTNAETYSIVFPANPSIYLGQVNPITSNTGVWNTFWQQPGLPSTVYFFANLVSTCSWTSGLSGYIWYQIIDSVTNVVLHNSYIYPNFNNTNTNTTVNVARQVAIKGTGNAINFNIMANTSSLGTATFFIQYGTDPSGYGQITIINLQGQS